MATDAKKATATAVSRALTDAGLAKSTNGTTRIKGIRRRTRGFTAKGETRYDYEARKYVQTGIVTVHWETGNLLPFAGDAERQATNLGKCAEVLTGKGYTVVANTDGSPTLTVTRPTA